MIQRKNINIKFPYYCRKHEKSMEVEASIGKLYHNGEGEKWHVSFLCEQQYTCSETRICSRLKPKIYPKSEVENVPELMKRIKNEC